MSDLDNLKALKELMEGKSKANVSREETEQKFIKDASNACFGHLEGGAYKAYRPEKMIEFLAMPTDKLQETLGGEWQKMDIIAFEALVYSATQKIKKSNLLIDWGKK